jgi:hypothetical protein
MQAKNEILLLNKILMLLNYEFLGKGSERQKSLHQKSKKEHRKSKI